ATVIVKDVEMHERTSAHYYDPSTWGGAWDALKWIDEPTNTFTLSFEKRKNNFYLTIFHPKYLKSVLYKETADGLEMREGLADNRLNQDRGDFNHLYLQNTHANMIWQI